MARRLLLSGAAVCCLTFGGCQKAAQPDVAASVNNRPISYAELEKEFQAQESATGRPTDDALVIQKLEVLRSMIDNEIVLQRAERAGLMASDTDVDAKFNELKAPYTQEEFQRQLAARKLSAVDLRAKLRRDLSVQKLFNKEITSQIAITDKDVADTYASNKASFNLAEPQVHLAQIVVTPQQDPNLHNLKNDDARSDEQAREKIKMLDARVRGGDDFAQLAQAYSEDPQSAPNGGDLGMIPETSLERLSPEFRKIILSLQPGQLTNALKMADGYRIFKVLEKEPAGQRELNDPRVQQRIRETLLNRKDTLLKNAYLEVARNEAKVVNNYAADISKNKGKPSK